MRGDTFRAAANDQLAIWAERSECLSSSKSRAPTRQRCYSIRYRRQRLGNADVLIIDTAGRLHTKTKLDAGARENAANRRREVEGAPTKCC